MIDAFLHVPKAGGTTLRTTLVWIYGSSSVHEIGPATELTSDLEGLVDPNLGRGGSRELLRGHMVYGIHRYINDEVRYFTMLRDPVSRALSLYRYLRNTPKSGLGAMPAAEYFFEDRRYYRPNEQVRILSGMEPDEDPRAALSAAVGNIEQQRIHHGVVELYDASLLWLSHELGWNRTPYYVVYNRTSAGNTQNLEPKVRSLLIEENSLDVELYRRARELFTYRIGELKGLDESIRGFRLRNAAISKVARPLLRIYRAGRRLANNVLCR